MGEFHCLMVVQWFDVMIAPKKANSLTQCLGTQTVVPAGLLHVLRFLSGWISLFDGGAVV